MFWGYAVSIAILAGIILFWPLIRGGGSLRHYALAILIFIPVATIFMYQKVGRPDGINVSGRPVPASVDVQNQSSNDQISELTQHLEQRLLDSPDDLQGWLLLGRTYKTMQKYAASVFALNKAIELAPEDPLVIVELAEAKMFSSGNAILSQEVTGMLEKALSLDQNQQKSLWLLGIASTQSGNDARAIELWERLVTEMDPSAGARASVQDQISQVRSRLGLDPAVPWHGLDIEITAGDPEYQVPRNAVLFVIARNPQAPGPPLGVRRISNPVFPVSINLVDADSMIPALPVSGATSIQLLARLSLSGSPTKNAADPESAIAMVSPQTREITRLVLIVP